MDALPDGVKALDPLRGMIRLGPGLSLANALRAMLRQDPDVVFADEVGTPEDLELLIKAALTGHATAFVLEAKTPEAALSRVREALPGMPTTPLIVHHTVDAVSGAPGMSLHEVRLDAAGQPRVERWSPSSEG